MKAALFLLVVYLLVGGQADTSNFAPYGPENGDASGTGVFIAEYPMSFDGYQMYSAEGSLDGAIYILNSDNHKRSSFGPFVCGSDDDVMIMSPFGSDKLSSNCGGNLFGRVTSVGVEPWSAKLQAESPGFTGKKMFVFTWSHLCSVANEFLDISFQAIIIANDDAETWAFFNYDTDGLASWDEDADIGFCHFDGNSDDISLTPKKRSFSTPADVRDFHFNLDRHPAKMFRQTCGNGEVEGNEECDGGACCASDCTFKEAGSSCPGTTGICAVEGTCSGDSTTCNFEPTCLATFSTDYYIVTYDRNDGVFTVATGPAHPVGEGQAVLYGGDVESPFTSFFFLESMSGERYTTSESQSLMTDAESNWLGNPDISFDGDSMTFTYTLRSEFEFSSDSGTFKVKLFINAGEGNDPAFFIETTLDASTSVDSEFDLMPYTVTLFLDHSIDQDDGPTFRALSPDSPRYLNAVNYSGSAMKEYIMEPNRPVRHYYEVVNAVQAGVEYPMYYEQPITPDTILFGYYDDVVKWDYVFANATVAVNQSLTDNHAVYDFNVSESDDTVVKMTWSKFGTQAPNGPRDDVDYSVSLTTRSAFFVYSRDVDNYVGNATAGAPRHCNDGFACTWDYHNERDCFDDECLFIPIDAYCDDQNACTIDTCDQTATGFGADGCLHLQKDCSDQIDCTSDSCSGDGVCSHEDLSCDDGLDCTQDSCSHSLGRCLNFPNDAACVNTDDVCYSYWCDEYEGCLQTPINCDDDIACTIDTCDPTLGCQHTPDNTFCSDGHQCTLDVCDESAGKCISYPTNSLCDDGNGCTNDFCDYHTGCTNAVVDCHQNLKEISCARDFCISQNSTNSICVHLAEDDYCDDYVSCTIDRCDMELSECTNTPSNDLCDDGLFCTDDFCDASIGGCQHVMHKCDDGIPCTTDWCDETTQQCISAYDGVGCDDGVDCTVDFCNTNTSRCQSIADDSLCATSTCANYKCDPYSGCVAESVVCDDQVYCTIDTCDAFDGQCVYEPASERCDDGLDCTEDVCLPGVGCVNYPSNYMCDDEIACTDDVCNGIECTNTPNNRNCDDGIPCTVDICTMEGCTHTTDSSVCDDGIECTHDTCHEKLGCMFQLDDNVCSSQFSCVSGVCGFDGCHMSYNHSSCDDGQACSQDSCTDLGCEYFLNNASCSDDVGCTDDICIVGEGCQNTANHNYCSDGRNCTTEMCSVTHGCIIDDALCAQNNTEESCINCVSPRSRLEVTDYNDGTADFRIKTRLEAVSPFTTASPEGLTDNMLISNFGPVVFGTEEHLANGPGVVIGANSGFKLVPTTDTLPACTELTRGMMIVQSEDNQDSFYICLRDMETYSWSKY